MAQETPPRDRPTSAPAFTDVPAEHIDALIEQSEKLRLALDVKGADTESWRAQLASALSPPVKPSMAIGHTEVQRKFLEEEHAQLIALRRRCIDDFRAVMIIADAGAALDDASRKIVLEGVATYLRRKSMYDVVLKHREKQEGALPQFLAAFAQESVEEVIEGLTPLQHRGLARANLQVRSRLAAAGVKRLPPLRAVVSAGGEIVRDTFKVLRPDSYATVLLMSYYLHLAEDKTRAALQFGAYLVVGGYSNAMLGVAERTLAARLGGGHILSRLPKNPAIMIAAALLCIGAASRTELIEDTISDLERRTDPLVWGTGGTVAHVIVGGAMLDQIAYVSQLAGLTTVDPDDQMQTLTKRLLMMDYDRKVFGMHLARDIRQWDALVRQAAARESNPVKQKLLRLQSIDEGPGGRDGWVARQALDFYARLEMLRGTEVKLGSMLIRDKIVSHPSRVNFSDYVTIRGDLNGALTLKTVLASDDTHSRIAAHIDAVRGRDPKDERVHAYDQCVAIACRLADLRSAYEHLGVYSDQWVMSRRTDVSAGTPHALLPDVVERGMLSQLAYEAARRQQLEIDPSLPVPERQRFAQAEVDAIRRTHPLADRVSRYLRERWESLLDPNLTGLSIDRMRLELSALRSLVSDAARILPARDLNRCLEPVAKLTLSQTNPPLADLEHARKELLRRIMEFAERDVVLREANPEIRDDLRLDAGAIVLQRGMMPSAIPVPRAAAVRPLESAWANQLRGDVIVIECLPSAPHLLRSLSVFCPDDHSSSWTIVTRAVQAHATEANRAGIEGVALFHSDPKTQRYEAWAREHPAFAAALGGPLSQFMEKRKAETRAMRRNTQEAAKRSATSTIAFVRVGDEYRMRWGDYTIVHTPMRKHPSFDVPVAQTSRVTPQQGDDDFAYDVYDAEGRKVDRRTVWSLSSLRDPFTGDPEADRQRRLAMRAALSTPLEDRPLESLRHLIVMVPGTPLERSRLIKALSPLYGEAKDRQVFLNELLTLLASEREGVTSSSRKRIAAWFDSRRGRF